MVTRTLPVATTALLLVLCVAGTERVSRALADEPASPIVLNDDGAWCWFQDERVLVQGSTLLVGSVANGSRDPVAERRR